VAVAVVELELFNLVAQVAVQAVVLSGKAALLQVVVEQLIKDSMVLTGLLTKLPLGLLVAVVELAR
jgi:hypothetical protein